MLQYMCMILLIPSITFHFISSDFFYKWYNIIKLFKPPHNVALIYLMIKLTIFQMTRTAVMMILTYPIVMQSRNSHNLSWTLKPNDVPPRKRRRPNKKTTGLQQTLIRSISQTLSLLPRSDALIYHLYTDSAPAV